MKSRSSIFKCFEFSTSTGNSSISIVTQGLRPLVSTPIPRALTPSIPFIINAGKYHSHQTGLRKPMLCIIWLLASSCMQKFIGEGRHIANHSKGQAEESQRSGLACFSTRDVWTMDSGPSVNRHT